MRRRRKDADGESQKALGLGKLLWAQLPYIRRYLRPYRGSLLLAALLSLLGALVALAQPWPLAFLVDTVLANEEPPAAVKRFVQVFGSNISSQILVAVLVGVVIALISSTVNMLNTVVQTRLEQRMVFDFRSDLFQHVQRLSMGFHDSQRKGLLMFAINDQASAVGNITVTILPLAEAALTLVGMLFIAWRLDPLLAGLSLVVVPFVSYSTSFYGKHVEPRLRNVRGLEAESLSIVHEAMSMLRVIVAFRRERHEHARFRRQGKEAVDARVDVTLRQTAFTLGVGLITAAGTALVVYFGARLVLSDRLTVGGLLVILSYIAAVYQPLEQVSGTFAYLQDSLISLEAATALRERAPEVDEPTSPVALGQVKGEVTFEDVDFSYQGRVDTLKNVSLVANAGEVVAIVGPTGAGKSTLVSLLPRFFDPDRGRITLDGHDIRDLSLDVLRSQISLVLQEPLLFSGTIEDNIRYGRLEATEDEIVEVARAANCHDFIARLPNGYKTVLGERGAQLSGGERQRISIARAFLKDAPILILDEPTSAVDSRTEGVILEALGRLMAGRTTLMIAHRLSTVRNADRIVVLNHGQIEQQGTHAELLRHGGLYKEMYEAQTQRSRPAAASVVEDGTDTGAVGTLTPAVPAPLESVELAPSPTSRAMALVPPPFSLLVDESTAPRASLVVVARHDLAVTKLCLASVAAYTGSGFELIVVDSASTDGTREYLQELQQTSPGLRLVTQGENPGSARAVNLGLAAARGPAIAVLMGDVVVTPGWLDRLLVHADRPSVGMVTPVAISASDDSRSESKYVTVGELVEMAGRHGEQRSGEAEDTSVLTTSCAVMRRDVYARLGPLDEGFSLEMFSDDDYAMRLRRADYRVVRALDAVVHHQGEAWPGRLMPRDDHRELFGRNLGRFEEKWNTTWQPHASRVEPLDHEEEAHVALAVADTVPAQSRVAVVSTAAGDPRA